MPRVTDNPTYGVRKLYLGCPKGLDVWNLQVKLIAWGSGSDNDGIGNTMDPVRLTGEFDTTTRDAVMRFQLGHKLPVTGIVDGRVFRDIDLEAALHPVVMFDLRCPCARGDNDGPILCRCTGVDAASPPQPKPHPDEGKCTTASASSSTPGKFLLDGKKLADDTDISDEKLDVYDKQEYEGMDKTVLWAVRGILHRAKIQFGTDFKNAKVAAGYRCWHDNYHYTDGTRWHHRQTTFHLGKTIEFTIVDKCTEPEWKDTVADCPECRALRQTALEKCGFQSRWHEPGRVSMAEGKKEDRPPSVPFAVGVDTVRLHERKSDGALDYTDHFVKTDMDAAAPLYPGSLVGVSFPMPMARGVDDASEPIDLQWALDPQFASSEAFFRNIETGPGGFFPIGLSRVWHGGIHLNAAAGAPVFAIADGEIVGCRMGEDEVQPNGSRNFVLIRHEIKAEGTWKDKVFYSLYMHLDGEEAKAGATVRWRRELFQRSKDFVEAAVPAPIFEAKQVDGKSRLVPKPGLNAGDANQIDGAEILANTKDDRLPADFKMYKLAAPLVENYFFTNREGKAMATKFPALPGITNAAVIGLEQPIKVFAGELIGRIGKAPKEGAPTFLHMETFSEAELPLTGTVSIDATDASKIADRKAIVSKLIKDAKLLPAVQDGVLTPAEIKQIFANPPFYTKLRSVSLKMPSAWSVKWEDAFAAATSLSFLDDPNALGTAWDKLNWWDGVKSGKGKLPADPAAIYHYHPIALILQLAYR